MLQNYTIKYLGTEYGGWHCIPELIPENSYVIDAGVGEDVSFAQALYKEVGVNFIFIDPTPKAKEYYHKIYDEVSGKHTTEFINRALMPAHYSYIQMHENRIPNHVSESIYASHDSVSNDKTYYIPTISIPGLKIRSDIQKFSLVKLDIEGAEYEHGILEECIGIKQICIEFHHFCMSNKTIEDTKKRIQVLTDNDYDIVYSNDRKTEFLFCLT